jgi:hypothetical protein
VEGVVKPDLCRLSVTNMGCYIYEIHQYILNKIKN